MEVIAPSPNGSPTMDHFDFNGARISPYLSAPSSPKRFGEFYNLSAPTSPSRFFSEFDYFSPSPSNLYHWEQNPSTPKGGKGEDGDGFAFFVGEESDIPSRSAEELFDGGKIKPLNDDESLDSAKSPLLSPNRPRRSPIAQGKKVIREAFSPRKKKDTENGQERRGRDMLSASKSGRRISRSLSPYRISHYTWEEELKQSQNNKEESNSVPNAASLSSTSSSKSSRKWRLRDFLLFRSASEGRGSSKDPLRKYPLFQKKPEEGKGSSFRSSDNNAPRLRRKEPISAHELHYARKKAESEDLKKRTFLPYKQGILGMFSGLSR